MTAKGLPRFSALLKRTGAPKPVQRHFGEAVKFAAPGAREGADLLSELTTPPTIKIPPTPAPAPTPTSIGDDALQKDRARRRQRINAAGRGGTILTGGSVLGGSQTGSSILGG